MPDSNNSPSSGTPDPPAGSHSGEITRAWQLTAYRSIAHHLTQVLTCCAQATELISTAAANPAGAEHLLGLINEAGEALDAAHDLAYEASGPTEAYCAICGQTIGILASTGAQWEHWEPYPDPISGRVRNLARETGHLPVPARRPRSRPAIAGGRIVPAQRSS